LWEALWCHYDPHRLNNTFISFGLWTSWTCEDSHISPQILLMVFGVINMCVLDVCVCGLISLS
jgi:hypothetical protein